MCSPANNVRAAGDALAIDMPHAYMDTVGPRRLKRKMHYGMDHAGQNRLFPGPRSKSYQAFLRKKDLKIELTSSIFDDF